MAERPSDWDLDYDDPMWGNYSWVAMLDPVELSHHVVVSRLREELVGGRPAWRADLVPERGYAPRCGGNCCELLYSEVGRVCEVDDPADAYIGPGADYPDHYDVALDVECASCAHAWREPFDIVAFLWSELADRALGRGKGLTFDSGGLCLKTAEGMLYMKMDMAGAAATVAIVSAATARQMVMPWFHSPVWCTAAPVPTSTMRSAA